MINILPGPQTNEPPRRWSAAQALAFVPQELVNQTTQAALQRVLQDMDVANWYGTSLAGFLAEVRERIPHQQAPLPPGIVRSTQEQRTAATSVVANFQPYQGNNPALHLQTIMQQFQAIQPFLAPDNTMGGQGMWEDSDPMMNITTDGIALIYHNILDNKLLAKICTQGSLAIQPAMGSGEPYTLLSFLKGTLDKGACSQATEGEMSEWIAAIREQLKQF